MGMIHGRAKKGGEYGANGEWYEGGKFIAKTERPKSQPRAARPRKVEVEPCLWVESCADSIFTHIKWDVVIRGGIAVTHPMSFRGSDGELASADSIAKQKVLIDLYNNGERWTA